MEGISIRVHDPMTNRSIFQQRALNIARRSRTANSVFRCRNKEALDEAFEHMVAEAEREAKQP
jgi:hypothetical protein